MDAEPELFFQMLADPTRLRILMLLQAQGELCVCELTYADFDKVSMNVGFYYMANAGGRLTGTILSGWVW